jgi:predicted metal-dependent hydrolase
MGHDIEIIRSNRRTLALQITADGRVVARAPLHISDRDILRFAESRAAWIDAHLARRKAAGNAVQPFTVEEMKAMAERARIVIPRRVAYYAPLVGVSVGRITLRFQRTRWGSCSVKGNLSFNAVLAAMDAELLDYVVVHELCHRRQMNHSPRFWAEVARVCPDWRRRRDELKRCNLLARIPKE